MGTAAKQVRQEGTCLWCQQTVELAADGAWQTIDSGSSGCMASIEQGGDGEHEADTATIEVKR